MISHRNVIANVLQMTVFEKSYRDKRAPPGGVYTAVSLGLLPQSHIYALVVICHAGTYRGDQTIVLPKFELKSYLSSIARFKISALFLVGFSFPEDRRLYLSLTVT
jgi:acyl-CoA synthetase (AMP-forming)/AMP-acid ligase II